jgi:hypothetical protein
MVKMLENAVSTYDALFAAGSATQLHLLLELPSDARKVEPSE